MNTTTLFSSATDQWATPQAFFDELNAEFHFTLDAAADETNHKCDKYFDKKIDGLSQNWATAAHTHTHTHTHMLRLTHQLMRHVQQQAQYGAIRPMAERLANG